MSLNDVLEERTHDRIYRAGFSQGYDGKLTRRHYAHRLDQAAWTRGLRDGIAESKQKGTARHQPFTILSPR